MSDDDPPRSRQSKGFRALASQARSEMTQLLLLFGVAVLVALNGFFVAAEFALVRASQARASSSSRDEGRRGAALVARSSSTTSTSTCRPASSASRWPRSASASSASPRSRALFEDAVRRRRLARRLARDLARARLPDHDLAAHHARRAGAEDLRDRATPSPSRCASRGRCELFRTVFSPFICAAQRGVERILRLVGVGRRAPSSRRSARPRTSSC